MPRTRFNDLSGHNYDGTVPVSHDKGLWTIKCRCGRIYEQGSQGFVRGNKCCPTCNNLDGSKGEAREEKRRLAREARAAAAGCTVAEYAEIHAIRSATGGRFASAYAKQKKMAEIRGIPWRFTQLTWWKVWEGSGKWDERGTGSDQYVMSRYNDTGEYSPDNVYIGTVADNARGAAASRALQSNKPIPEKIKRSLEATPYFGRSRNRLAELLNQ